MSKWTKEVYSEKMNRSKRNKSYRDWMLEKEADTPSQERLKTRMGQSVLFPAEKRSLRFEEWGSGKVLPPSSIAPRPGRGRQGAVLGTAPAAASPTNEKSFLDSPETGQRKPEITAGNTHRSGTFGGEEGFSPAPQVNHAERNTPGIDHLRVLARYTEAEQAGSERKAQAGFPSHAREEGTDYPPPDYTGTVEKSDTGESTHHSGAFGALRAELPEAYRGIPEKADYSEYSRYTPTGAGKTGMTWQEAFLGQWLDTGYDDPVYEVVNGNTDAINKLFSNESVSGSTLLGTDSRFLGNLNDTEKGVYNYLHATQGKEAANRFLYELEGELNARQREKEEAYWTKEAERNPVGMSVFSVLTKPLSYFSYLQQAEKTLSGETLDPTAGYNRGSYTANAIRGAVSREIENSGKWGKVGSYGYNLAMSMGDFLYTSAITGGMEPLALTVMGTEAAADSVLAAKERGLSDERSFITGTIAGIVEAATEHIGFDALFKTGVRSLGRTGFKRYILRNAGAEAAEEGASDLLNWIADDLYDLVTGTEESEFKELVAVYEENGLDHTKALLSALGDRGKELGLDTLGGFLSGLFLSGGKSGYNAIQFNRMGQEAFDTGSYRDYISLGLLADHDTEAYQYAQEIRAKLNAGRAVTNIEMGQLTAAVYADALGVGEKRTTEAREEPDEDIWDGTFNAEDVVELHTTRTSTGERARTRQNTVDSLYEYGIMDTDSLQLSSHNMHNSSDELFERSKHVLPVSGYDDVFIHGNQWGVSVKDADGNDIDIPAEEFIKTLKSLKLENDSIRLCACEAGLLDDGFASFVARAINKPVMAPTTLVWIGFPDNDGISKMELYEKDKRGRKNLNKPGRWRVFNPDGSIEEYEK